MSDELLVTQMDSMPRDIQTITVEINTLKVVAGQSIIEIGERLIEAKAQLNHGEWLPWLSEQVQFSEASAQRFMRIAKEYGKPGLNPSPVTDLGVSKALQLLALPDFLRDEFIEEKHEVNGVEKTVYEMTKKELDEAIKAKTALEDQVDAYEERAEKLEEDIEILKAQLEKAKSEPKEVKTVEIVPDKEAEEKLKDEIKKLKADAEAARSRAKELSDKQAALKEKAEKADKEIEKAKKEVRESVELQYKKQIEQLQKQVKESGDSDVAVFKVHFDAIQQDAAKMKSVIDNLRTSGKSEQAEKLTNAYKAVIQSLSNIL